MRLISMMIAAAVVASPAFAQQTQRSSNPQGVQIQGNTDIKAKNENVTAVAVGEGNEAKNTTGAIKGGTQIQGQHQDPGFAEERDRRRGGQEQHRCQRSRRHRRQVIRHPTHKFIV
jgi:hypothetical protein